MTKALLYTRTTDPNSSNEALECVQPATYRTGRTPAVIVPGSGGSFINMVADQPAGALPAGLAEQNIVAMTAAFRNANPNASEWGNDTHIAAIAAGFTWMSQTFVAGRNNPSCRTDRKIVVGWSAGALGALNYARTVPSQIAAILIWNAALNVEDIRANNRGSFQAAIEARYTNLAGWTAARPTHNPIEYAAADLTGIPIMQQYASNDATVDDGAATNALAFAAAIGATTNGTTRKLVNLGAIGHSGLPDITALLAFVAAVT